MSSDLKSQSAATTMASNARLCTDSCILKRATFLSTTRWTTGFLAGECSHTISSAGRSTQKQNVFDGIIAVKTLADKKVQDSQVYESTKDTQTKRCHLHLRANTQIYIMNISPTVSNHWDSRQILESLCLCSKMKLMSVRQARSLTPLYRP